MCLTAAVSHEYSAGNRVRINREYEFSSDISGTAGRFEAGERAHLTQEAEVWTGGELPEGHQHGITGDGKRRVSYKLLAGNGPPPVGGLRAG
ncbi:TPA: autotransporter outer membrane beta-barrel domain-containing protein [Salmonella enterica subsp. enterica serovar Ball]|nr:autotransporter outer membrane beta-barrel domain-containing protein [Salmonella enterica subsp. enterica serovar Ball]